MGEKARVFFSAWVALILGLGAGTATAGVIPEALHAKASSKGSVRVIVQLGVTTFPEEELESAAAVASQRRGIAATRAALLAELAGTGHRTIREFETIPFVALEVAPDAMTALEASNNVIGVEEDRILSPLLSQSVPLIGADQAWAAGFDGTGPVVAILDTGVDKTHPFLSGKLVEEACFSSNGNCPNGLASQTGPGAGVPCTYAPDACRHGTRVAGIAAGSGAGAGVSFSGVAKGAQIIAVQVFSRFTGSEFCGAGEDPCALAFTSDVIAGAERVLALSSQYAIAAVNLSLGGGRFTSPCDSAQPAGKALIDNLRSVGIATVIASGNDGFTDSLSAPACISTAVSVGSTTKSDVVSFFSNSASFLSLLAPGQSITSSVPDGGFDVGDGTSFAAPHVAGAWAILKQKKPTATVEEVLIALAGTGLPITDPKSGITKPRIQVDQALQAIGPSTPVTAVTFSPDKPSPQPVGTPILWTALATGGTAPQFQFWVQRVGGPFTLLCAYSPNSTCLWTPTEAGDYFVFVWARSTGSSAALEADAVAAFHVEPRTPVAAVTLTPDKPSPQPVGTTILWTALATGGTAPQFQFWVQRVGGPFTLLCAYSPSATCPWTPTVPGDYVVIVWAKSQGSHAAFEADKVVAFRITAAPPVTAVTLTPSRPSPQPANTPIVWTAVATGGTLPQFRFWVQPVGGTFSILCDYSPSATCPWTPSVTGDYVVIVWAKSIGSSAPFEAFAVAAFQITGPTPVTAVTLTPSRPSPQPFNTPILWTAVATDGTLPQFRFWVRPVGGAFTLLCDYSPTPTCPWTPTVAGDYVVVVWAKSQGSPAAFEAFAAAAFRVDSMPRVRFLNSLVRTNGQHFTAELRSTQGNVWFSFSGVPSAYQPTARTIGNFDFRDGGTLVATCPCTFNLPTTGPQFFTLVLAIESTQLVLQLLQDIVSSGDLGVLDAPSAVAIQTLESSTPGRTELRYAPMP